MIEIVLVDTTLTIIDGLKFEQPVSPRKHVIKSCPHAPQSPHATLLGLTGCRAESSALSTRQVTKHLLAALIGSLMDGSRERVESPPGGGLACYTRHSGKMFTVTRLVRQRYMLFSPATDKDQRFCECFLPHL